MAFNRILRNARHSKRHARRGVDEAELEVPISDAYELADAAKSRERLAEGHALGKIVLTIRNATTLS